MPNGISISDGIGETREREYIAGWARKNWGDPDAGDAILLSVVTMYSYPFWFFQQQENRWQGQIQEV